MEGPWVKVKQMGGRGRGRACGGRAVGVRWGYAGQRGLVCSIRPCPRSPAAGVGMVQGTGVRGTGRPRVRPAAPVTPAELSGIAFLGLASQVKEFGFDSEVPLYPQFRERLSRGASCSPLKRDTLTRGN